MNFLSILYSIIILPIESIIEFVFCFVLEKFSLLGVAGAIVAVSLIVNFLALPIYNIADEIQLKERSLQKKLAYRIAQIKTAFKGDEQFMMLSEYYRQNNYHPLYALRQSLSILIEIPFFIAAYHFLSNCPLLENQSILFLKDLSKPDALIHFNNGDGGGGCNAFSFSMNILPVLMTVINIISSFIYTKDAPLREKIQTNMLAIVFLIILYNSPCGLVFYWILNNTFSLCKNVVLKMKHPGKIVHIFLGTMFVFVSLYLLFLKVNKFSIPKCCFYIFTIAFIGAPYTLKYLNEKKFVSRFYFSQIISPDFEKQSFTLLLLSTATLWILCGLLLPSNIIATSPSEFSFLGNIDSPMYYIHSSCAYFLGIFVFWPILIYKLLKANKKVKILMPMLFFVLALCALANAFLFKNNYGLLSLFFTFEDSDVLLGNSFFLAVLPLLFCLLTFFVFLLLKKKISIMSAFLVAIILAQLFICVGKINSIRKGYEEFVLKGKSNMQESSVFDDNNNIIPQFHLSKSEKNVVVLFLDRAISCFFPYIMEEFPELKNDFDGFVYYPNCLSFGCPTNLTLPSMLGGYEYSPDELNKKANVLLKDKHNEALLVIPKIFSDAGFNVTVADLPYANYKMYFDKEFYDNIPYLKGVELYDKFEKKYLEEQAPELATNYDEICNQRLKRFCALEILYPPMRKKFYNSGKYFSYIISEQENFPQKTLTDYSELFYLSDLTTFDSEKPTLTIVANTFTHYDGNFTLAGSDYHLGLVEKNKPNLNTGSYNALNLAELTSYQTNAAAYLLLSKWIKYLKENNCYDNTRIIVVADHGHYQDYIPFRHFPKEYKTNTYFPGNFNPLFLIKDFNAKGYPVTNNELITNAETLNFAREGLNVSDINPFTSRKFQKARDFSAFKIITLRRDKSYSKNNPTYWEGMTQFLDKNFLATLSFSGDNIFDEKGWLLLENYETDTKKDIINTPEDLR